jgi:hypothetical protein
MPILGQDPPVVERPGRGLAPPARPESSRGDLGRSDLGRSELGRGDLGRSSGGHEPMRPPAEPAARRESVRPGRGLTVDPIRAGRDALMASLDRPLTADTPAATAAGPGELARPTRPASAFDEDPDAPKEVPAVPSLAVLRPRRTGAQSVPEGPGGGEKPPRKRLPSWDDVLFGSAPAARESS